MIVFEEQIGSVLNCTAEMAGEPRTRMRSEIRYARKRSSQVNSFDIRRYLNARKATIDRALYRVLKGFKGHSRSIWRAMHYGLFPGGKRIRPILTLAAGELFGGKQKILLPFACALELIHSYSIIHDDLPALDNDDLRRGRPTTHKVHGEGMALLAGDALLTEAFHLMSGAQAAASLAPGLVLEIIHEVSHAVGVAGLVGGQAFDLEAEDKEADLATVEYIHVRKTGALILAAVRVGARVAGAKQGDLRKISRYGEFLGLAFQIADDILDVQGETDADGRGESGKNEVKKATYPSVVGLPSAKNRLLELLGQCEKELIPFGSAAAPLKGMARRVVKQVIDERKKSPIREGKL
jgi:geranylgeranyl diphosphate synthase, type II